MILDRRLLVVTGKGGVGRTTSALALALAATRRGKRVCVVEMNGMSSVPEMFGYRGRSYAPRPLTPQLDAISLTPEDCLDEFGKRKLKVGALAQLLFRNRVISAFLDAVPGLADLLQLGKLENLIAEPSDGGVRYDLVVLDAPATGHGLTMLASARSMAEITRVGPFHELSRSIEAMLADTGRTAIALVTLPEELPVTESLELLEGLDVDRDRVGIAVINQVRERPLPDAPPWEAVRPALEARGNPELGVLVALADRAYALQTAQSVAITRFRAGLPAMLGREVPVIELPFVPGGPLGAPQLTDLADTVADQLGGAS